MPLMRHKVRHFEPNDQKKDTNTCQRTHGNGKRLQRTQSDKGYGKRIKAKEAGERVRGEEKDSQPIKAYAHTLFRCVLLIN